MHSMSYMAQKIEAQGHCVTWIFHWIDTSCKLPTGHKDLPTASFIPHNWPKAGV